VSVPIRRFVVLAALALFMWAAVLYATGGVRFTILDFRMTSRDPVRPFALAFVLLAVGSVVFGRRRVDDECEHVAARCGVAVTPIAIAASFAVTIAGLHWGTFAASGVDAYGYVSQAALWERGAVRVEQPFVAKVPWPDADWAFAPMGYRPAVSGHAMVPSYPPGLPLLMAFAERIAGDCGPYYVVPVLGGLCVWFCYLLGRRAASPIVGACAAALLACSPPFLFQLMAPMSDVPAAAFWTAALYFALREDDAAAAAAGVCAASAVVIRPNLAPLAAVILASLAWSHRDEATGRAWKRAAWFAAPVLPALIAIATINWRLYGSPTSSGYGDLSTAYEVGHIAANARRYTIWLIETHTWLIGLSAIGLLAPVMTRSKILESRASLLFLGFALVTAASYLTYAVFEEWLYLRFFLPVLPVLLVAMAASMLRALGYLTPTVRALAFVALATFLVTHELLFAIDAGLTKLGPAERRYVAVARFIEAVTPQNAVLLSLQHGGSVRHYAGRLTVRFDRVSPDLDRALDSLEGAGWRPFILLEDWEEPQFKGQFGGSSAAGRLAWRPYARLDAPGGVNIYDPKQLNDAASHELAVIPPPDRCDCRHY